jgi:hypothetical protein
VDKRKQVRPLANSIPYTHRNWIIDDSESYEVYKSGNKKTHNINHKDLQLIKKIYETDKAKKHIYLGQDLKVLKTGEWVTVLAFDEKEIIVQYNGKSVHRSRDIIGKTLLVRERDEIVKIGDIITYRHIDNKKITTIQTHKIVQCYFEIKTIYSNDRYEKRYERIETSDANINNNEISSHSPIAQALLGRRIGETINCPLGDYNFVKLKILDIE